MGCCVFRFQMQYGVRAQTALPYAMNSEFSRVMATQMVGHYIVVRYCTAICPDRMKSIE